MDFARLAGVVEVVGKRAVRRAVKEIDEWREELMEAPGDSMRKYRVVFAEGKRVAWDRSGTLRRRRRKAGRPGI